MHSLLKRVYITLEKIGFNLAHANIAVSPRDRDKAVSCRIGHYDDYRIIRSGVEFENFKKARGTMSSARKMLGIPQSSSVVGAVMRFCEEKAPDIFVKVAGMVLARRPDTLFVLVGDGPLKERTENWIDAQGLRENFILLGSRKDISAILPAFNVFLITSRTEGLPRALLESLAAGIPSVSTDVGGIHELVDGKRNGLLYEEGDVESLAGGVLELLGSPERVTKLLGSVDSDLEPFSAGKMVDDLFDLYTRIVSPSMRVMLLCDNEPFNIPHLVENVIRKSPFNEYFVASLPGHGSFRTPVRNLKRYAALYGFRGLPGIFLKFISFRIAGFLRLPTRNSHSLKQASQRVNAKYIHIKDINTRNTLNRLSALSPDVFVSVACPQILRKEALSIPSRGCWNVHSSLLPNNRGMLPTFWSLIKGDQPGVTMHLMDAKLDSGGILLQESVDASIESTSLSQLLTISKITAAMVIARGLSMIERGGFRLLDNPSELATFDTFPARTDVKCFLNMGGKVSGKKTPRPRVALSFDIEEWFQTYAARRWHPQDQWNQMEARVPEIIYLILDMLDAHRAKATFFFLGWIFQRHPSLAEKIVDRGHEIGYHGFNHVELASQSREKFRINLDLFLDCVRKTSIPVPVGFRAPSFSITKETSWVVDEIVARGFIYDSSVYPMFRHRYGIPSAPLSPFELVGESTTILELPLASIKMMGVKIPMAGGAYMRFYPGFLHRGILGCISRSGRIPVLYFHPWEIDTENTSSCMNPVQRFRQHHNSGTKTINRLSSLLRRYRGVPLRELVDEMKNSQQIRSFSLEEKMNEARIRRSGLRSD
jgi:polysaccharide deacetylase family protein (PEP-CTERM system associated)